MTGRWTVGEESGMRRKYAGEEGTLQIRI